MELKQFFEIYPEVAIAFSGGVDSAYLLYAAKQYGKRAKAYYVKTAFQPRFELEDAFRLAKELASPPAPAAVKTSASPPWSPWQTVLWWRLAMPGGTTPGTEAVWIPL